MKEKRGKEIIKYILKTLAITGAFVIASASPYFLTNIAKRYFRHRKYINRQIAKYLSYLKTRGLIKIQRKKSLIKISLSERGRAKLKTIQIQDIKIKKPSKWDGRWRIIIFDIPKKKDRIRDMFRMKLREFGFYQLQKSVWIYPYECQEEVVILRNLLGINKCVKLIVDKDLEIEKKILTFFNLKN